MLHLPYESQVLPTYWCHLLVTSIVLVLLLRLVSVIYICIKFHDCFQVGQDSGDISKLYPTKSIVGVALGLAFNNVQVIKIDMGA